MDIFKQMYKSDGGVCWRSVLVCCCNNYRSFNNNYYCCFEAPKVNPQHYYVRACSSTRQLGKAIKTQPNYTELKNKVQLQNIKQNKINDTQKQARTVKSMDKLKYNR